MYREVRRFLGYLYLHDLVVSCELDEYKEIVAEAHDHDIGGDYKRDEACWEGILYLAEFEYWRGRSLRLNLCQSIRCE